MTIDFDQSRIAAYSLLAHINNHDAGIKDLGDIFIPLVKRVLARMNAEGRNKGGSATEIKALVDRMYSLDIPYPLLNRIIKKIALEINDKAIGDFIVYNDGAFAIRNFVFSDYDDIIREQESEIEILQNTYVGYLKLQGANPDDQPSIFDFLDRNRIILSQYFATDADFISDSEGNYLLQANFIKSVRDQDNIYKILKKIYLGSIISSYLEITGGQITNSVEFLLDTNFIIGLVDLHSLEATHTCRKIVDICQRLGHKLTVLNITIEETQNVLRHHAQEMEFSFLEREIYPESIHRACSRKSWNRTDLEKLVSDLPNVLVEDFGVNLIPNSDKYTVGAKHTDAHEFFKKIRRSAFSAIHDASAIYYVRQKRGKSIVNFADAKCWFLMDTNREVMAIKNTGFQPEIIRAEDLVNILYLTNPQVNADDMLDIGLTRLVSSAISNAMPNARVLREVDELIQKYSRQGISDDDLVRVSQQIANKTVANLESLIEIGRHSPDKFNKQLSELAQEQRFLEAQKEHDFEQQIASQTLQSEQKLRTREDELKIQHQHDLEVERNYQDQKHKTSLLEVKESLLQSQNILKLKIDSEVRGNTTKISLSFFLISTFALIYYWDTLVRMKDTIEQYQFFLAIPIFFLVLSFWFWFGTDLNSESLRNNFLQKYKNSLYRKNGFDLEKYSLLCQQIERLKDDLSQSN